MSVLVAAVLVGLAASGLTAVIRAVVQEARPLWLLEKPLSCDLCMSWWSSLVFVIVLLLAREISALQSVVALFGGVGISLLSVKAANRLSV